MTAVLGLDFGTTNSVAAVARGDGAELVTLTGPDGAETVFRISIEPAMHWLVSCSATGISTAPK